MKILILLFYFILNVSFLCAAPATNIQLAYDIDTQMLHIEGNHPTDNMDRDFIRKVVVTRNYKESQDFFFTRQTRADKFIADLSCAVQEGDHLDVFIYVSEGGLSQASIDIPKKEEVLNEEKTVPSGK